MIDAGCRTAPVIADTGDLETLTEGTQFQSENQSMEKRNKYIKKIISDGKMDGGPFNKAKCDHCLTQCCHSYFKKVIWISDY